MNEVTISVDLLQVQEELVVPIDAGASIHKDLMALPFPVGRSTGQILRVVVWFLHPADQLLVGLQDLKL